MRSNARILSLALATAGVLAATSSSQALYSAWARGAAQHAARAETRVAAERADAGTVQAPPGAPSAPAELAPGVETPSAAPRTIDLALCLDTSGSMSGLIESAKQKLWAIVNDLALAEPEPRLRVALLTFGNDGHAPQQGWVRTDVALTDDLDRISQELFALTTNGGTELVGRVVHAATTGLAWSPGPDAVKLIVVAGNESADQDREVTYVEACRRAIARDIVVHAVYCGDAADGIAPGWRDVALRADGQFASIDHASGTVVVETPFDAELARLSTLLNGTYIPLGDAGRAAWANQSAQDTNALGLNSEACASRATTKANGLYFCGWDLIDSIERGQLVLADVEASELPEAMRAMTLPERERHVATLRERRGELQGDINALSAERKTFVAKELARRGADESAAFDHALRRAIRAQAVASGFRFADEAPVRPAADAAPEASPAPAETPESGAVVATGADDC